MNKEEKRINYLLDTIIECPSIQTDELRKRIRRLFKTIDKQEKEIENLKFANKVLDSCLNDFYRIEDKEIEDE